MSEPPTVPAVTIVTVSATEAATTITVITADTQLSLDDGYRQQGTLLGMSSSLPPWATGPEQGSKPEPPAVEPLDQRQPSASPWARQPPLDEISDQPEPAKPKRRRKARKAAKKTDRQAESSPSGRKTRRENRKAHKAAKKAKAGEQAEQDTADEPAANRKRRKHRERKTTKRDTHDADHLLAGLIQSRRRQTVAVVDGQQVSKFTFRNGGLESYETNSYDSADDAFAAAAKPRRSLLVWCGALRVVPAHKSDEDITHSEGRLLDAQHQAEAFGEDSWSVTAGNVSVHPHPDHINSDTLAKAANRVVLSGLAVNPETDGIWLRIGLDMCEATLVSSGMVASWRRLCVGARSIGEAMADGLSSDDATEQFARRVFERCTTAMSDWQRDFPQQTKLWVHGQAAAAGSLIYRRLTRDLQAVSTVLVPSTHIDIPTALTVAAPQVPTAAYATASSRLLQPRRVLTERARLRTRRTVIGLLCTLVAAAAMVGLSLRAGQTINRQIADLETRTRQIRAAHDADAQALSQQAETAQQVLTMLEDSDGPNWELLFRLNERFPEPTGKLKAVNSDRVGTALSADRVQGGFDGYVRLITELKDWAVAIYGPDAGVSTNTALTERGDGTIELSARIGVDAAP